MATQTPIPKIRWKVHWPEGAGRVPSCVPLPGDSTVADLVREVKRREGLPHQDAGETEVDIEIQVELDHDLCEVSLDDLLLDHVPLDSKDAKFVAIRTGSGNAVTPVAPSPGRAPAAVQQPPAAPLPQPVLGPPPATSAPGTLTSHRQPSVLPRSNQVLSAKISSADAAAAGVVDADAGRAACEINSCCSACDMVFSIGTPTFCCRVCGHLFHSECAGYNTSRFRQFPPPDWICPRCPNGERGPSEMVHRCLKGKGKVNQRLGNQPWCPICLGDNRAPGRTMLGTSSLTRCRGCGLHTHASCLEKLQIGPDGRWPCDECQRRRDGVVPGSNPVWMRLTLSRLDGGWEVTVEEEKMDGGGAEQQDHQHHPQRDSGSSTPEGRSGMVPAALAGLQSRRSCTPRRKQNDKSSRCEACGLKFTSARAAFSCRSCRKDFHAACAGYNPSKRWVPPPDWICPHCPNGERGPSESGLHPSFKGKGAVVQKKGNMPWCPICLTDNRISGTKTLGDVERCPGCDFHTHASCLANLQIWPDGRWPCDECDRRRDGVVPGDNPVWLRLKAARLDGGTKPTWTHKYEPNDTSSTPAFADTPCPSIDSDLPIADSTAAVETATAPCDTSYPSIDSTLPVADSQAAIETAPALCDPPLMHNQIHHEDQHSINKTVAKEAEAAEAVMGNGGICNSAGFQGSHHLYFSGAVTMAVRAAAAAARAAASARPPISPPTSSVEVFDGGSALPQAAETRDSFSRSPTFDQTLVSRDLGPSNPDTAPPASLDRGAEAPLDPAVNTPPTTNQHAHLQTDTSTSAEQETAVGGGASAGIERQQEEERRPSPAAANIIKGPSAAGNDAGTHVPVDPPRNNGDDENCCEACRKVFVPVSRPSFCCRSCHKLFHGACTGYCRHQRQSPPPDWICPRCPNGERGPTEDEVHRSLRGKGTVTQQLGNQKWCPICLNDDRAPGSAERERGSKKCTGCGLLTHAHCLAGIEVGPDGGWPCDECQRRRTGVVPGSNMWLRLKAARLDGGLTASALPPSGATTTPDTFTTSASTDAAPNAGSPISSTEAVLKDPASRRYDAAITAPEGATPTASPAVSFASLSSCFMLPSRATASNSIATAAPQNDLAQDDAWLNHSHDGDEAAASISSPPYKKARVADSNTLWQLLPRSAFKARAKAAENIALAAAMLCGGTPDQQKRAEDFVVTELAQHDQDLSKGLTEKLRGTANVNDGGVWVNRKMLMDELCGTNNAPSEFLCISEYIVGSTGGAKSIISQQARQCFNQVLQRSKAENDAAAFVSVGDEGMLWWKGTPT